MAVKAVKKGSGDRQKICRLSHYDAMELVQDFILQIQHDSSYGNLLSIFQVFFCFRFFVNFRSFYQYLALGSIVSTCGYFDVAYRALIRYEQITKRYKIIID